MLRLLGEVLLRYTLVQKENWGGGLNGYSCYFDNTLLRCELANTTGSTASLSTTQTSAFVNNWKHVAFAWNGTTQILYVNGVQEDSDVQLRNPSPSGSGFAIGRASYTTNGTIDEVRIYNRALTSTEIAQLYNGTKTNYFTLKAVAG